MIYKIDDEEYSSYEAFKSALDVIVTDAMTDDLAEELIDEVCEEVHIGNLTYSPGYVLREVDPAAFRDAKLEEVDWRLTELYNDIELHGSGEYDIPFTDVVAEVIDEEED